VPAAVVLLAVVAVIGWRSFVAGRSEPGPTPTRETLAAGVVTPQEIDVTAAARSDGTVRVEQRLTFEATAKTDDRVVLTTSHRRFGWVSDERPGQYWFTPTIEDASAVDETSGSPVELEITRKDWDLDTEAFIVADGHDWGSGRHALRLTYTLSDVWFDIQGDRVLVIPLDFFASDRSGRLDSTIVRVPGQKLSCPANNLTWDPEATCAEETTDRWSAYRDQQDSALDVLAVVDPEGVTADPAPAPIRKRDE